MSEMSKSEVKKAQSLIAALKRIKTPPVED